VSARGAPTHDDPAAHHTDTSRLEAFSDGVIAIAITLLVLEIGVPHVDASGSLSRELLRLWPSYFGYAVSFLTIGVLWINHHAMLKDIGRTDHTLLVLNLILLMLIAFLPFPTAVLAEYMKDGGDELFAATMLYGGIFTLIAVVYGAMWFYAAYVGCLIDEHVTDARIASRTRRYLPGTPFYALTLPLALITPWISLALYAAAAIFYLLFLSE
jgi:uncharacterized membrane protein